MQRVLDSINSFGSTTADAFIVIMPGRCEDFIWSELLTGRQSATLQALAWQGFNQPLPSYLYPRFSRRRVPAAAGYVCRKPEPSSVDPSLRG